MASQEFDEKHIPQGGDNNNTSTPLAHIPTASDTHAEEHERRHERPQYLQLPTEDQFPNNSFDLPSTDSRERSTRLVDDLTLLQAERAVSREEITMELRRSTSRIDSEATSKKEDVFNQPNHQPSGLVPAVTEEKKGVMKVVFGLKKIPRVFRYLLYSVPITAILLIPILLGIFMPEDSRPVVGGDGGVEVFWFGIWLEIVWLSLWIARMFTSLLPFLMIGVAKAMGSGNSAKWKDAGRQIELHFALFLWMLAVLISYQPIIDSHRGHTDPGNPTPYVQWIDYLYKVIIALFVLAVLNFVEKIIMQWVANSFHMRTYSLRIEQNKQSIAYLVHLYEHSKDKLVSEASVLDGEGPSGAKTPIGALQTNARFAVGKVGDIANRMAGDFTGRAVQARNHPRKVVSELLRESSSAQVLARRLFRTYADSGSDLLRPHDLRPAFPSDEDAEQAFGIFDRDLNGDVSMEELEAFCDEVHREKKTIAASLKDLDSVITKLDRVFFVIILIISIIVLISILSAATAAALASLGTVVLGLSWLMQATAQEFLQSIIFVFVKHPLDVGDRVTIYGNTGTTLTGDDYYVTEISLLYTEFKKMEGHIVQAPNSTLNTLFILNHRRSGALADVFSLQFKYGTPASMIKELEARMSEFVLENKRDYTSKILTEVTSFEDTYRMKVNFICFHKTSFQNELIRLIRHNKFACELMSQMMALGIEQPRQQIQISGRDFPVYQTNIDPPSYEQEQRQQLPKVDPSLLQATRRRANSRSSPLDSGDHFQDVFSTRRVSNAGHFHHPPPRIREEEEPMASGASLAKVTSSDSKRSGQGKTSLFRNRSRKRESEDSRRDGGDIV